MSVSREEANSWYYCKPIGEETGNGGQRDSTLELVFPNSSALDTRCIDITFSMMLLLVVGRYSQAVGDLAL